MIKKSFTLSEVLITLIIIGIISAITIPTIHENYQKTALETQYKKVLSTVSNAVKLAMVNSGTSGDFSSSDIGICYKNPTGGSNGHPFAGVLGFKDNTDCFKNASKNLFNIALDSTQSGFSAYYDIDYGYGDVSGYTNILDELFFPPAYAWFTANLFPIWEKVPYAFLTSDGVLYGFFATGNLDMKYEDRATGEFKVYKSSNAIVVDINGTKKPNKPGKDLVLLHIDNKGNIIQDSSILNSTGMLTQNNSESDSF